MSRLWQQFRAGLRDDRHDADAMALLLLVGGALFAALVALCDVAVRALER